MSEHAFALKENVKDFADAAVSLNGETVRVKQRLDNNDGVIVTDDGSLIGALRELDSLKEVPVPEPEKPAAKSAGKGS